MTMKQLVRWVISAGVLVTATATGAQVLPPDQIGVSPYVTTSDVGGPYAAMPPDPMPPRYAPALPLLPPQEVYAIVRENGFSPLGVTQQHGLVYTVAVIDRDGEDGRLVIDARNGRIIRFLPAFRIGYRMGDEVAVPYGRPRAPPRPTADIPSPRPPAAVTRPLASMPSPPAPLPRREASRSPTDMPLAKAVQPRAVGEPKPAAPLAATPTPATAPIRQSAIIPPKPAEAAPPAAATAPVEAKPSLQILPTQAMPKAQGLD
jgi:hypothetical protein